MSDDIVTRLREAERLVRNSQMDCDDTGDLIDWCADAIEHLQAENDKASALIAKLAQLLLPYSILMNKTEQQMLIKLVRGE